MPLIAQPATFARSHSSTVSPQSAAAMAQALLQSTSCQPFTARRCGGRRGLRSAAACRRPLCVTAKAGGIADAGAHTVIGTVRKQNEDRFDLQVAFLPCTRSNEHSGTAAAHLSTRIRSSDSSHASAAQRNT